MLKLNASYSKKVPAEGEYTSQSYHCSMEVELSDALEPDQLKAKIHETFALVRESVEAELHGKAPALRVVPSAGPQAERPRQSAGKATNRQLKYVLDLAKSKGIPLSEVNAWAQKQHRVATVYELDSKAASQLVDHLKAA